MIQEYSAGALVYRKESDDSEIKYLLLRYTAKHWDFPKGHMEEAESKIDTMRRETKEETGITDLELVDGYEETIRYRFSFEKKVIQKDVYFFLAKTTEEKVTLSEEHIGYEWLPFDEALSRLTFNNAKELLTKANKLLTKK